MDITLLYFDDCPNWEQAAEYVDTLAAEFADLNVTHRLLDTNADAVMAGRSVCR